ncbi:MAG: hypothetical protein U9Q06_04830 [Nanoarchaeota archaeon]|nr:hypothetical protein [Nanoarchaeota archaeon]
MVSITLSIPKETRTIMKHFPEINWSGLVRKTIIEKAKQLAVKEMLLNKLKKENEFDKWAVNLVRAGRENEARY